MSTTAFVWKLPSISLDRKKIICGGYVRENYDGYMINPIIKLFARFYNNDPFAVDDIKNAHHLQRFLSPIFEIKHHKWYLEFYPNGSNDNNEGTSILYICLAILPPKTLSVEVKYQLSLLETETNFVDKFAFNKDEAYDGWPRHTLKFADIQNVDSFTFTVEMPVVHEHQTRGLVKTLEANTNIPKQIKPKISTYKWIINTPATVDWLKKATIGQFLNGPVMTFGPWKIYLQFCPRGRTEKDEEKVWVGISIWYWPPHLTKSLMQCKLIFYETGLSKSGHKGFDADHLCLGWCANITYQELKDLDQFTLIAEVSMIDIFDVDGNNYHIEMEEDKMYKSQVNMIIYNWYRKVSQRLESKIINLIINYIISKEIHEFNELTKYQKITYEWNVCDDNNITDIKNAGNVFAFASPIFEVFGMKWYLGCWCNGSRKSREGTVNIFLNLITFQSVTTEIPIRFDITWKESNNTSTNYDTFMINGNGAGETYWPLKTKDIKDFDTFTIKLDLSLLDVIENNKIMTHKYVKDTEVPLIRNVESKSEQFEWNVITNVAMKLARFGEKWNSEAFDMFNMKWRMIFYPNGQTKDNEGWTDLCLNIDELPDDESIVCIRYQIYIKEFNMRYIASSSFYKGVLCKAWGKDRLSTDRFREVNIFTIQLKMQLVDVYHDGTNRTAQFV